jgi:hypothetical protein
MRYYFDIVENGRVLRDDEGDDITSDQEARAYVRGLLADQVVNLLRAGGGGATQVK